MTETSSQIFDLLRLQLPVAGQLTRRDSDIDVSGSLVGHAVDQIGNPMLVVPLDDGEADIADDETRGIRLETHAGTRPLELRQLILRCTDRKLWDQFSYFADDCLASIRTQVLPPGVACLDVLGKWRNLLGTMDRVELSVSQQVGLIAELHFFEEVARARPEVALESWLGVESGRHDFVFEHLAIEVKATTSRDRQVVRVHGLAQMEAPARGELFLYVEQLERTPHGDSVVSIVDRILDLRIDRRKFLSQLALLGFRLDDSDKYRANKFSTTTSSSYAVGADFPRITRDLMTRPEFIAYVSKLEYSLDLSSLSQISAKAGDAARLLVARAVGTVG